MKRKLQAAAVLLCAILVLTAGSANEEPGNATEGGISTAPGTQAEKPVEEKPNYEPVTLKLRTGAAEIGEQEFQELFVDAVQRVYPHITVETVAGNYNDMIIAGELPDIMAESNVTMNIPLQSEIGYDLTPIIQRERFDLERFIPVTIEGIREYGSKGEIYGIPFGMNIGVLLYNKDIFDRFAVDYPKDAMTWNELITLSEQLTRTDGAEKYFGFSLPNAQAMMRHYSLDVYDESTGKALIDTDSMKTIFNYYKRLIDIPGYLENNKYKEYNWNNFLNLQNLAMYPNWYNLTVKNFSEVYEKEGRIPFDWDMAGYPVFEDRPGLARQVDFHVLMVSKTSKHKDDAFRVIEVITSDEVQNQMATTKGRSTVLDKQDIQRNLGSGFKFFEGKNIAGIVKNPPAPAPKNFIYNQPVYNLIKPAVNRLTTGIDVNTLLRDVQEQADAKIKEIQATEE